MKKGSVTRFKLDAKKPPKSDWCAFDAMSEKERHRAAVSDPDALPATAVQLARARRVPTVRAYGMRKTGTTRVSVKPGDTLPRGETDWTRLDAMTDDEVQAAAQSDPDAQPLTPEQLAKMRRLSRVKALRQRLGMTQAEFAEAFHLPITTLRDWEQRRSTPDAPARALLLAIERDPDVMRRLLADRAA